MKDELLYVNESELPLDNIKENGGYFAIFRKICCIGDSLSSGEFELVKKDGTKSYHDIYEQSWGQYISYATNAKVYNFSKGGLSCKEFLNTYAIANDCYNLDKACQAYIIALGVNDLFNIKVPFGTIDDIDVNDENNNKDTYAGQYGAIITKFKRISPDAKFFFVTFPNVDEGKEHNLLIEKQIKFLYDLTKIFTNSYVIDLKKYGPKYDKKFKEIYYLNNHLNPLGYKLTATIISSYIDYIIRHNYQDFKYVGLINHLNYKEVIK